MQVTTEQIDPCKVAMTISVEPEKVAAAREKAFQQLIRNLQIPGFRKGKVPPQLARGYVDEGRVVQRAAEMLLDPSYQEALEETKLEPYAAPDLDNVDMPEDGTLVYKISVPLKPVVTLGPFRGLDVEKIRLQVTDADVDRQIEELRTRQADYEEVFDRTAQMGDIAFADLTAEIEGQDDDETREPRGTMIEIGKNIPDFDNGIVGMELGETKTIDLLYPEDFPEESMRGKRATFTVNLKELRLRKLPELNDEFAAEQKAYPDANTVEELRAAIREGLERAATEMADSDLEHRIVARIVETSQIHFPDVLLRQEMQEDARQLQERLERDSATLEQYLEAVGKTREQVEQEMAIGASRRIRNSLVLSEVARAESITVEDADVDAELSRRAEQARVSVAALRAFVEKNNQLDSIRNRALTDKVLAFLKEQSNVTERVVTDEELRAMQTPETAEEEAGIETAEAEPLAVEQAVTPRRKSQAAEQTGEE